MQMNVAAQDRSHSIAFRRISIRSTDRIRHGIHSGIAELVSSCALAVRQPAFRFTTFYFDVAEFRQTLLHARTGWEDPGHWPTVHLRVHDRLRQVHEAAALGIDRRILRGEFSDGGSHGLVCR